MPQKIRGLRAMHARVLDGPHGRGQAPWRTIAAIVAWLLLAGWCALALPATGQGSACDGDAECPPALSCRRGKCAP